MDNKELIKLWSNDTKRRDFIKKYRETAEKVIVENTLELGFFITTLPNGHKIIAMEYWATNYDYHTKDTIKKSIRVKYYYQDKEWFEPTSVSDSFISEKLKDLKIELQADKWQ